MNLRQLQTWKVYLPITGRPIKNDHWSQPWTFQPFPEVAKAMGKIQGWGLPKTLVLSSLCPAHVGVLVPHVSPSALPHRSQTD